MASPNNNKTILTVVIIILIAIVAYMVLNKPDTRNPVQKMGDAVEQLPNGTDNAARDLKDRTPAERIRDDVKDATN